MTHEEITEEIDELLPDNTNEDISPEDVRTCLKRILGYAQESRWITIITSLDGESEIVDERLEGQEIGQLLIINEASVISAMKEWKDMDGNYDSDSGTIQFLGELRGQLEIYIRPKAI